LDWIVINSWGFWTTIQNEDNKDYNRKTKKIILHANSRVAIHSQILTDFQPTINNLLHLLKYIRFAYMIELSSPLNCQSLVSHLIITYSYSSFFYRPWLPWALRWPGLYLILSSLKLWKLLLILVEVLPTPNGSQMLVGVSTSVTPFWVVLTASTSLGFVF
jgi:hypothetical protein